jgi:RNA 3'-phosphate cyclase
MDPPEEPRGETVDEGHRGMMIEIDGSQGEGGGQILRMAVALAALRGRDVRVTHIRAGRPNPGLAAQHVAAVNAVAELCSASVSGLDVGSPEIVFRPGAVQAGRFLIDVGTAGSVTLVLQACLPVAFGAPDGVRLEVTGGTDVRWSPPLDAYARVFLPWLHRLGAAADLETIRRGYYPRGGGKVEAVVRPAAVWSRLELSDPGVVRRVRGIAHVSNLSAEIPKRMKHAAMRRLHGLADVKIEERVYAGGEAIGQGGALVLWGEMEHSLLEGSCLAERGKSSERVGEEAAAALSAEISSGASVDVHNADQLLVYLCQAEGPSTFLVRDVTGHLKTMAWLLPQFFERQIVIEGCGKIWRVRVGESKA